MSSPAVVIKSKFVLPNHTAFQSYISYIDRDEAVRAENNIKYDLYTDWYMDNDKKTTQIQQNKVSALFTDSADTLTLDQKQKVKQDFLTAQQNGSPLWQNVISFDNSFLEGIGVLDGKTNTLDEEKLRQATRQSMIKMLSLEQMEQSAIWSGAIHYNTDNIHVHIAIVEPFPTRPFVLNKETNQLERKGIISQKTIDEMKLAVGNTLYDKKEMTKQINDIVRHNLIAGKRNHDSLQDSKLKEKFLKITGKLPHNRPWQYASLSASLKQDVDAFSRDFISTHHKQDFTALNQAVKRQVRLLKRLYGESPKADQFQRNVYDDLFKRMGNSVLNEMKQVKNTMNLPPRLDSTQQTQETKSTSGRLLRFQNNPRSPQVRRKIQTTYALNQALYNLKLSTKKDIEHIRNQIAFAQLQRQVAQEIEVGD